MVKKMEMIKLMNHKLEIENECVGVVDLKWALDYDPLEDFGIDFETYAEINQAQSA